jgi:hypothetical protein
MLEGGGGVGCDLWHCEQSLPLLGYAKAMSDVKPKEGEVLPVNGI